MTARYRREFDAQLLRYPGKGSWHFAPIHRLGTAILCLMALVLVGACHSATPPRTGPLPEAHSCYLMSRSILTGDTVPPPSAVWLLLSDQSKDRFGAHSFSAVILQDGRQTAATWHATAKDSIQVQWPEAGSERQLRLHEDQNGVRGRGPTSSGNATGTPIISGRRISCALATIP